MIAPNRRLRLPRIERARLMRWVICALVMLGLAPSAFADDLDILRGSEPVGPALFTRWSGFYAGGQFSYSDGSIDFSKATQPLVSYNLRDLALEADQRPSTWPVLSKGDTGATGFGAFAGYNTQWQDLILGIEASYNHAPFTVVAGSSPLGRVVQAGSNLYSVNLSGTGSMEITDYGSLRGRAGWILDNFLPYGFVGLALGVGNYSVTSLIYGQQNSINAATPILPCDPVTVPTCVDYRFTNSAGQKNALLYGFSVGGGVDMALTSNIFMRAEYEYIQFAPIANITAAISSVRVGAGLKF